MVPVDSLTGRTAANRATARVALPGRAVLETLMVAAAVTRTIQSEIDSVVSTKDPCPRVSDLLPLWRGRALARPFGAYCHSGGGR